MPHSDSAGLAVLSWHAAGHPVMCCSAWHQQLCHPRALQAAAAEKNSIRSAAAPALRLHATDCAADQKLQGPSQRAGPAQQPDRLAEQPPKVHLWSLLCYQDRYAQMGLHCLADAVLCHRLQEGQLLVVLMTKMPGHQHHWAPHCLALPPPLAGALQVLMRPVGALQLLQMAPGSRLMPLISAWRILVALKTGQILQKQAIGSGAELRALELAAESSGADWTQRLAPLLPNEALAGGGLQRQERAQNPVWLTA